MKKLTGDEKIQLIRVHREGIMQALGEMHDAELGYARASGERKRVAQLVFRKLREMPEMRDASGIAILLGLQVIVDNFIVRYFSDEFFSRLEAEGEAYLEGGNGVDYVN